MAPENPSPDAPASAAEPGATPLDATTTGPAGIEGLHDLAPAAAMGLMFLAAQLLAILVAGPFEAAGIRAFEDPESLANPFIYLGLILGFTIIILIIAKYKLDWLIQTIILGAIGATMVYVFWPLLALTPVANALASSDALRGLVQALGLDPTNTGGYAILTISVILAALMTWLLYKFPEWYIVDSVGILVSAGATAIFGVSFGAFPAIILLVLLAVYDYISVYKTKHMLALADSVVGLRLPIMLVVPKHKDYSFLDERERLTTEIDSGRPREAMFMGLGDIVIPSVLVVIGYTSLGNPEAAIGALIGTFVGFVVLMSFVLRGKAHAGLPSLNGGSIAGFMLGFFLSGAPLAQLGIPGLG